MRNNQDGKYLNPEMFYKFLKIDEIYEIINASIVDVNL